MWKEQRAPHATCPVLGGPVAPRHRFGSRGWCTGAQRAVQAASTTPALSWEADLWAGLVLSMPRQHAAPLLETTEMALLSSPSGTPSLVQLADSD